MSGDPPTTPVSREEHERLARRVAALEAEVARLRGGAPSAAPPVQARPVPVAPAPLPTVAPPPAPRAPPPQPVAPARPPPARAPRMSVETLVGERLAPRIGAVLVFLAALFFLGVGIQRGWIGPMAQLALAAAASFALLGVAHWLTRRRGYGTYPQVLEGTAVCVLYATAFFAHATPYYQRVTNLTETGGGVLMALVAAGGVGLALWRDARVIAGLAYLLSFLTALLGRDAMPGLTLAYVALLGASLALVVARKRWFNEGIVGSLLTGGLLVAFAFDAANPPPSTGAVYAAAFAPAAALLWLSLARDGGQDTAIVGGVTLAWAVAVSVVPLVETPVRVGQVLLAWSAASVGLAVAAHARRAGGGAVAVYGGASVLLYLAMAPLAWYGAAQGSLAITMTYALAALALAGLQHAIPAASRALWQAGLVLASAAALRAVFLDGRVSLQLAGGSWEAWATFAVLAPAFGLLLALAPTGRSSAWQSLAFGAGVGYLAAAAFTLYGSHFLVTMHVLVLALALAAFAARATVRILGGEARAWGLALLVVAALKSMVFDAALAEPALGAGLAFVESAIVAAAFLALYHLGGRGVAHGASSGWRPLLVGASALMLVAWVFAYGVETWVSIMVGAIGVGYLVVGFVWRAHAAYRQTGFVVLGLVLLRVFTYDLGEADLVVRAAVFAALGVALLGIGYVYARARRTHPVAASAPAPEEGAR